MRALTRPNPDHVYNSGTEVNRLTTYRDQIHQDPADNRHIPAVGQAGHVLLATWNIANLGVHRRRPSDLRVIAAILSWFEIVAIQEIADNLSDFIAVVNALPNYFDYIFNDRAGNDERAAYIFDTRRVTLGQKIGEVAIVESDREHIQLPGVQRVFHGFNRNPYLASFVVENTRLLFANCHLIYGPQGTAAERTASIERRQLEAYAIARYCDLRRDDSHAWTKNIIAIGDFNLPIAQIGDPIYDALTKRGLRLAPHSTRLPHTNVSNSADYDQMVAAPGVLSHITQSGVFDFDGAIFSSNYNASTPGYWRTCTKYYISDHRPLRVQFALDTNQ